MPNFLGRAQHPRVDAEDVLAAARAWIEAAREACVALMGKIGVIERTAAIVRVLHCVDRNRIVIAAV